MRSAYYIFNHLCSKLLTLLIISLFSSMAYSADPLTCVPTSSGLMPARIDIYQDFTVTPAGSNTGQGYIAPNIVVPSGPITCASYTPTDYTIIASAPDGSFGTSDPRVLEDIGQGFKIALLIDSRPGYSISQLTWSVTGGTPNVPVNYYPGFIVYPPANIANTSDIKLNNFFLGYIELTGRSLADSYVPSDKGNMTAIYFTGTIHVPPFCTFELTENSTVYSSDSSMVTMPSYFAADFAAAGAGGLVGTPLTLGGTGNCQGGTGSGNGDTVHISFISGLQKGRYIAGTTVPEIGFQLFDDSGQVLPLDGSEAATATTHSIIKGETVYGAFDYPLKIQLVSVNGKAPTIMQYSGIVNIILSMD